MHLQNLKAVVEYESLQRDTNNKLWIVYTEASGRLVFLDRDVVSYDANTEEFETLTTAYVPAFSH